MSTPRLPASPPRMLVISGLVSGRELLAQRIREARPELAVEGVASFADAVLRLAQGDIQLVLLDLSNLPPLSPAAPLMLRGLAPGAHLLALGAPRDEPGFERLANAGLLTDWLRRWR